jgi:hypothetical protein
MSAVFERGPTNPHLRLLLLALADHADDDGVAWPSVERLAAKSAVSARQVQRSLQQLEAEGWLVVDRGRGRGHTSRYRLAVARLRPNGDAGVTHPGPGNGDVQGGKGDMEGLETVTPVSPEPSREPPQPSTNARPATSAAPTLIDLTEVSSWLSAVHPGLAANARTAPPATAAIAAGITAPVVRRLLEAGGHRTDRPAVIAHVLPRLVAAEVDRRHAADQARRDRVEAAAVRREPAPHVHWPPHVATLPIAARLAWLRSAEGLAWAGEPDEPGYADAR